MSVELHDVGIVIYSDGSAKPNPGYGGSGIHGYIYSLRNLAKTTMPDKQIVTQEGYKDKHGFVDQENNICTPIVYFDVVVSYSGNVTNNFTELNAVLYSLDILHIFQNHYHSLIQFQDFKSPLKDEEILNLSLKKIVILTDSEYVQKGINEWSSTWVSNNWVTRTGEPVKNSNVWKSLLDRIRVIKDNDIDFKIKHVDGHNGVLGNEIADLLAIIGTNRSVEGFVEDKQITFTDANKYWKKETDKHDFLDHSKLYYNALPELNRQGVYFLANPGKADIFGKRTPDNVYTVLITDLPIMMLEFIKSVHVGYFPEYNTVLIAKLDKIYNKSVYEYIKLYQKNALIKLKNGLFNFDFIKQFGSKKTKEPDNSIIVSIEPPSLSLKAMNQCEELYNVLLNFKNNIQNLEKIELGVDGGYNDTQHFPSDAELDIVSQASDLLPKDIQILDISSDIIETSSNKKKQVKLVSEEDTVPLRIHFTHMDVVDVTTKILLSYGLDIIHKNNLKRLLNTRLRVYLVIWMLDEVTIRYGTIIRSNNDFGIWSSVYSNLVLL